MLSAFLLGSCQAASVPESAPVQEMSIKEARASSVETIRVTGTVAVQSRAFASSLTTGFAIQDRTAGIYVLDAATDVAA